MLSFKLDPNGDLSFDPLNNIVMVEGREELTQRLSLAIRLRLTEWFLDATKGIDWFYLLGEKGKELEIKGEIRRVLYEDAAIKTVETITIEATGTRTAVLTFEVVLTEEPAEIYRQLVEV